MGAGRLGTADIFAICHLPRLYCLSAILREVCDQPLAAVAEALGTNPNAVKALLHRARAALATARRHLDVDGTADPAVVERLVRAIEMRSVDAFTELLAEDVWGVVDGGGIVPAASKPTHGVRAVSRQWANANRRQTLPLAAHIRILNGEPAVLVTVPEAGDMILASIHVEARGGRIAALRVVRDPRALQRLSLGGAGAGIRWQDETGG